MVHLIEGPCEIHPLRPERLDALVRDALVAHVNVTVGERFAENMYLRITGAAPETRHAPTRSFHGYLSRALDALEVASLDALDRSRVQYVEGVTTRGSVTGRLFPAAEPTGANAPGCEPWLVIAMQGQTFVEQVSVVMARSEAEAAARARVSKNGVRDLYTGRTADGETYVCTLRRLASCPSF